MEMGGSCMKGETGTVEILDMGVCIRWDTKFREGSGMVTSFTGGARIIQPAKEPPPESSPTFVFLDLNSEPWLVHEGWLHRWNRGAKCWVTARELRNFELGEMEKLKLKPELAALYGPPCSENEPLQELSVQVACSDSWESIFADQSKMIFWRTGWTRAIYNRKPPHLQSKLEEIERRGNRANARMREILRRADALRASNLNR